MNLFLLAVALSGTSGILGSSILTSPITDVEALRVVSPPPSPAPAPVVIGDWPAVLPPTLRLQIRQQPDWSDSSVYPPDAAALNQEGVVVVETIVGTDGTPRACRVASSSGHAELDNGTCQLMLQMRFAPPRDAEGRSAESLFRRHIDWALNDAVPLAPARLTAHLTLDDDRIDGCTVDQEGPVPEAWARIACRIFTASRAFYLPAAHLPHVATITVEIQPAGSPALTAPLPPGRLIATRRTEFDVDDEGDPTNCRTTRNEGFGSGRLDRQTPCGFFASGAWFDTDKAPRGSLHGAVEVRVYLGEAGAH